jgi:putative DNA methylase
MNDFISAMSANFSHSAIEYEFPFIKISKIAEQESWRKEINRPIYHIHKYWATRLGSVFRGILLGALLEPNKNIMDYFYEKNNFSSKVIFDPFMGSGTTLGEAIKLGAKAIGCDTNPLSTFIVNQSFENISEEVLLMNYKEIEKDVKTKIQFYYKTKDPVTGQEIPVLYYFWVKILECPNGEIVPLFSNYIFSKDAYPKKKPIAQMVCPSCWSIIQDRYDSIKTVCPNCHEMFNPQIGPVKGQEVFCKDGHSYKIKELVSLSGKMLKHQLYAIMALRDNGEKIYLMPRDYDFELYKQAEIELETSKFFIPFHKIRPGYNTDQAKGYNYHYWKDFFNDRQLLSLGILLNSILKITDIAIQEQFLCLFSSTLEFNNLFCSFKGEGTGAVRHLFSNHILKPERTPIENSVWGTEKSSGTFSTLFKSRLLRAKNYLKSPFEIKVEYDFFGNEHGNTKKVASDSLSPLKVKNWDELKNHDKSILILNGDSSKIDIPDLSIDSIITDPPYFDFVNYSELSDFFFSWLSPVLSERYTYFKNQDSSNKAEVQHRDPLRFSVLLTNVFMECNRILKNEGLLIFSFHHSRSEGWAAIYQSITNAGFKLINFYPVHGEMKNASPKASAKNPISIDALLICKKKQFAGNANFYQDENYYVNEFKKNQLILSKNDVFVLKSVISLLKLNGARLSYMDTCHYLKKASYNRAHTSQTMEL